MALSDTTEKKMQQLLTEESEDLENPSFVGSAEAGAVGDDKLEPADDKVPSGAGQLLSESRDKNVDPDDSSRTKKKGKKGPTIDGVILPRQDEMDHEEKTFFNRFIGLDLPLWVYGLLVSLIGLIALGVYCACPSAKASLATDVVQTRQSTENQGDADVAAAKAETDTDEGGPGSDIALALTEGDDVAAAQMEEVVDPLVQVMKAIELSPDRSLVETVKTTQTDVVNLLSNRSPGGDQKKYQKEVVKALSAFTDSLNKVRELSKSDDFWKCADVPGAEDVASKKGRSGTNCACPKGLSLQPVQDWHGAVRCLATGQTKWAKDMTGGLYELCECAEPKVSAQCDSFALGSEARLGKSWWALPENDWSKAWKARGFQNKLTAEAQKKLKEDEENAINLSAKEGRQCKCKVPKKPFLKSKPPRMVLSGEGCSQEGQVYFNILDRDVTKCKCVAEGTASEASKSVAESVAHYQISLQKMSLEQSKKLANALLGVKIGAISAASAGGTAALVAAGIAACTADLFILCTAYWSLVGGSGLGALGAAAEHR